MAEKTVYIIDLSDKVTGKLRGVQVEAKKTDSAFGGMESSLKGVVKAGTALYAIKKAWDFGVEVVHTTAKFQGLRNSIKFASDTAQQGELSMQWLSNLSKTYGLELTGLTEGFKTFQGAMMKTKFTSNEVRTMFAQVSTGVTAMGLSTEDAKGTFLALGQIMGKGKVQAEELRGQIGERIPGAFAIAARAMGMTTSELDKFMSDGKLLAEDFLPKFAAEMQKTFGQGAVDNADSLTASLNRSTNAWTEMVLAIGNSDTHGLIGGSLSLWESTLNRIATSFKDIKKLAGESTNERVLTKLSDEESHYKSQAEFMKSKGMSREEIVASFDKAEGLRARANMDKADKLRSQIAAIEKEKQQYKDIAKNSPGFYTGDLSTKSGDYLQDKKYQKLVDALRIVEDQQTGSQAIVDKVVSALYMPKNVLAGKADKTTGKKAGGLSLNESRNGETHINITIDTFQKNEFSKDGTNVNNSMVKNFLDQMAAGLATVLNDSQIAARQ